MLYGLYCFQLCVPLKNIKNKAKATVKFYNKEDGISLLKSRLNFIFKYMSKIYIKNNLSLK